jgi:alpha-beta hydrolase superfamily lysophospholipase
LRFTGRALSFHGMTSPNDPVPREWMHAARDGTRLYVRCAEAAGGTRRGSVLLTHGLGEHAGRYDHVAARLTGAGWRVYSWDLRGHGRSDGARGDAPRYEALVDDLAEVWELAREGSGGGPLFLHGHSTGGQIALNFAVRHNPAAAGLVITSPWLRLAFDPPAWKVALARVAAGLWPAFSQGTEVRPDRLSRDLAFLQAMPDPHLVHHRISARMYHGVVAGGERAAREAAALEYPMLLIHGANDPVTAVEATKEFFHALRSRDKRLILVPGALHETHNDLCREEVLTRMVDWLEEHRL